MSNFICSECGMNNIDCGRAGYKTPKEIELEKRLEVSEKEHYRTLEQLRIATKALNGIRDVWANNPSQFSFIARIANRKAKTALEEMEGVK